MTACVTVWTLVRVCVYRPLHPGWSPVHPRLLPAGCAALSASPAPTAPTWTHDDTPPPAGRSEKEMANMRMRKTKKLCWTNRFTTMRCIKNSWQRETGAAWTRARLQCAKYRQPRPCNDCHFLVRFAIQAREKDPEKAQQLLPNGSVPLTGSAFTPATDLAYTLIE